MGKRQGIPLWRDARMLRVAGQVAFVILVALAVAALWGNLSRNLQQLGIKPGLGFLRLSAGFDIGEKMISYSAADSYGRAILVGLTNTARVMLLGILLATVIGIAVGVARLSGNWLVRQVALIYVETLRNVPLLLHLFVWYFAVFAKLPRVQEAIRLPGPIMVTNRGVALPWPEATLATRLWVILLGAGVIAALTLWRWRTRVMIEQGGRGRRGLWALGAVVLAAGAAWVLTGAGPFRWNMPFMEQNIRLQGGVQLSSSFSALLLGLSFYTGAFIAEIVRAGIQAVSRGQWEAARALGLKPGLVMRLVVFPQALRVIVPPLTSQYLNLTKNSSLGFAIAYADLYFVARTTLNQTGRAVEVVVLLMAAYLSLSLVTSFLLNLFNRAVQLTER